MQVRRSEFAGHVTYYLSTEYGYGDSMEVTPRDLMVLGAWLLEHEGQIVDDALNNDVLAEQEKIEYEQRRTLGTDVELADREQEQVADVDRERLVRRYEVVARLMHIGATQLNDKAERVARELEYQAGLQGLQFVWNGQAYTLEPMDVGQLAALRQAQESEG